MNAMVTNELAELADKIWDVANDLISTMEHYEVKLSTVEKRDDEEDNKLFDIAHDFMAETLEVSKELDDLLADFNLYRRELKELSKMDLEGCVAKLDNAMSGVATIQQKADEILPVIKTVYDSICSLTSDK